MGSSLRPKPPSDGFLNRFRATADANGAMSFVQFMQLALYDPQVGYYQKNRARVGRNRDTDFYTATSVGSLFGELITQSCLELIGAELCAQSSFIEIGSEPTGGILKGLAHPFARYRTIQVGQPISLSDRCIVFSNELFDAQPCRRFVHRAGRWLEVGVTCLQDELHFVEQPVAHAPSYLPPVAPEGYVLDAPQAARVLTQVIASQPWTGLFLACDYGKTWDEIIHTCPEGTLRAYHQHQQSNDLLAQPGEQDLTCHICWDWLQEELAATGFEHLRIESQEAFLVRHAGPLLESTAKAEATRLSTRKMALMQLIHPAHMGHKFQVLHGVRRA